MNFAPSVVLVSCLLYVNCESTKCEVDGLYVGICGNDGESDMMMIPVKVGRLDLGDLAETSDSRTNSSSSLKS